MNTVRSVGYGWGILVVAGGGSYYFAKKSINADRAERAEAEERRRQVQRRLQYTQPPPPLKSDGHASPSKEAQVDVSPAAGHAEESDSGAPVFETSQPFRSKKGDRFS
ncbi:hypothetical protein BDV97DRAFT_359756 [Delphinella strobiligena]|nr:hypothetical protein BDV97DRAFT_359756 [Delphinella strobiligena]